MSDELLLAGIAETLERIEQRMAARNELLAESIGDHRESMARAARANAEHERLGRAILEATRLEEETMRDKELPPTPEDRRDGADHEPRPVSHARRTAGRPMGEDVVAPGFEERPTVELKRRLTRSTALRLMDELGATTYRKRSRVLATRMREPFRVETEHGAVDAAAGDWLVTNHPDDDPGTDVWPVSAERFRQIYVPDEGPSRAEG